MPFKGCKGSRLIFGIHCAYTYALTQNKSLSNYVIANGSMLALFMFSVSFSVVRRLLILPFSGKLNEFLEGAESAVGVCVI